MAQLGRKRSLSLQDEQQLSKALAIPGVAEQAAVKIWNIARAGCGPQAKEAAFKRVQRERMADPHELLRRNETTWLPRGRSIVDSTSCNVAAVDCSSLRGLGKRFGNGAPSAGRNADSNLLPR